MSQYSSVGPAAEQVPKVVPPAGHGLAASRLAARQHALLASVHARIAWQASVELSQLEISTQSPSRTSDNPTVAAYY